MLYKLYETESIIHKFLTNQTTRFHHIKSQNWGCQYKYTQEKNGNIYKKRNKQIGIEKKGL